MADLAFIGLGIMGPGGAAAEEPGRRQSVGPSGVHAAGPCGFRPRHLIQRSLRT